MGLGSNEAVAPEGRPLASSVTVWGFPWVTTVEMVDCALSPALTVRLLGLALMEKSSATPHESNLNAPMRVCQLNDPLLGMYSLMYQNVQSSDGSTDIWV